ncbi:hypothetical protein KM043_003663 [Ampulex compressa]|nr:hypothetical protein KM043_003663 [Ampulex compressa]
MSKMSEEGTLKVEDLRRLAEEEFRNHYGTVPTTAVFAPGCLTIGGVDTNFENISLSMAIQLVTVIVGKQSRVSKWCRVKALHGEMAGQKVSKFRTTDESSMSTGETSWIDYVKATVQTFKARRGHVPGFKIVIASAVPARLPLGTGTALVASTYVFLEAIAGASTDSPLERALACQAAERLADRSCESGIGGTLASIVGSKDSLLAFDPGRLRADPHAWRSTSVDLLLLGPLGVEASSGSREYEIDRDRITLAVNTATRWGTRELDLSKLDVPLRRETMEALRVVVDESDRVSRMIEAVRGNRWEDLGELLWEGHRSRSEYQGPSANEIECITSALKAIEGVLGVKLVGRGFRASILALVRRESLKTLIEAIKRAEIPVERYLVAEPSVGASILYAYERSAPLLADERTFYRTKVPSRYRLPGDNEFDLECQSTFRSVKSISLFLPQGTFLD